MQFMIQIKECILVQNIYQMVIFNLYALTLNTNTYGKRNTALDT